ncbi:MAG: hypothetical protein ABSA18_05975 [Dehalococcoidia bacterium]
MIDDNLANKVQGWIDLLESKRDEITDAVYDAMMKASMESKDEFGYHTVHLGNTGKVSLMTSCDFEWSGEIPVYRVRAGSCAYPSVADATAVADDSIRKVQQLLLELQTDDGIWLAKRLLMELQDPSEDTERDINET